MPPSLLALLPSPRLNWVPSTSAQPWQCLGAAGSADHPPQAGNRQQSPGFPEPSTGVFHGISTDTHFCSTVGATWASMLQENPTSLRTDLPPGRRGSGC